MSTPFTTLGVEEHIGTDRSRPIIYVLISHELWHVVLDVDLKLVHIIVFINRFILDFVV